MRRVTIRRFFGRGNRDIGHNPVFTGDHILTRRAMSDYDFRPGGSLKLKGGIADGGIVKK